MVSGGDDSVWGGAAICRSTAPVAGRARSRLQSAAYAGTASRSSTPGFSTGTPTELPHSLQEPS